MAPTIVEVIKRSKQGATEPFVCRADDDRIYFVKGKSAGPASLVKEWVAGKLAQAIELPIAPFEIVNVPQELIDYSGDMDLSQLGSGEAFGSEGIPFCRDVSLNDCAHIPTEIQRKIVAFDW